jgi:hypothetical protein
VKTLLPDGGTRQKKFNPVGIIGGALELRGKAEELQTVSARRPRRFGRRLLSPHDLVRGKHITFDWVECTTSDSDAGPYTVRLFVSKEERESDQVVWMGPAAYAPLEYPATAPILVPGGHYRWQLWAGPYIVGQAIFEVAAQDLENEVEEALAEISGGDYPPTSAAVLRGAALANAQLLSESREVLLRGVASNSEEAALHMLLGRVYTALGLPTLKSEANRRAAGVGSGHLQGNWDPCPSQGSPAIEESPEVIQKP